MADSIGAPASLVHRAGDATDFCRKIEGLLADDDQRMRLGREARAFVLEQFAWHHCCSPLDILVDPVENHSSELGLEHK